MTAFDATYFDGVTTARTAVRVSAAGGRLQLRGDGVEREVALDAVAPEAPLGDLPRVLRLPGGGQLQTADHAAVDALFPRAQRCAGWLRRLERHGGAALAALAVLAATGWWCVVQGIPLAAGAAARALPPALTRQFGAQALAALDAGPCRPSALEAGRRAALGALFERLAAGEAGAYRLELRTCPAIGPNAYALPGGIVVLLDELVALGASDRELAAVLAHEIGHLREQHALRLALQSAGVAALASVLVGDAASITALAVALPTLLLQSGYSREFETAADDFALARLASAGFSAQDFADMLTRLAAAQAQRGGGALDYLSTHPDTAARIERARRAR